MRVVNLRSKIKINFSRKFLITYTYGIFLHSLISLVNIKLDNIAKAMIFV